MTCFLFFFFQILQNFQEEEQLEIKFMKPLPLRNDVWVWPVIDDLSIIPYSDVRELCNDPVLVGRGKYTFSK